MAIVTEISWDDMLDGKPLPETPARKAWREAVAEIAEKAKATLPECNGRVDKAVAIVLNGDVELLPDGKAKVASQSNGTTQYFVVNGECQCKDFPKAPSGWCKHRIAAGMAKRATPLAKAKLEATTAIQNGHTEPQPVSARPSGEASPSTARGSGQCKCPRHPGWPHSQVTLRDSNEQRLLIRLETLLQRFPAEEEPRGEQAPPEGWCSKHGVQMTQNHKNGRSWWSHQIADGWCKGK